MIQHLQGNMGFAWEISPDARPGEIFGSALHGVAPLLAPGALALLALVAVSATYRHPKLERRSGPG